MMQRLPPFLATLLCAACSSTGSDSSGSDEHRFSERYVIATAVSDDSGSNTYVAVVDSLDTDNLDLKRAREFGGWSDVGVVGKWVFVSSGETPEVSRFEVNDDLELESAGKLSFANYVDDANFYNQELISPTKAYLVGENEFVIWNPSTLEITGTLPYPSAVEARSGIEPYLALDRGATVRGDRLYATLTWTDTQELDMLPDSQVVVIDLDADEIVDVLDVPCPDISIADSDDAGNLYFSNWVYSPGATLLYGDHPACAARIAQGTDEVDQWRFEYADVTGNEGAVVTYLGEDRWMYSSFLGDPDEFDPQADEWFDWLFGDTWQLEVFAPSDRETVEVTGIPPNGGGYYSARFDSVTYVLIPEAGYTATTIYAVGADGTATRKLHTDGWSTRLFKLE